MKARHLPSLEALVTDDDERMSAELDLLEASEQISEVRRMVEQVERIVAAGALRAEEAGASSEALARLGYKLLTTASVLRRRTAPIAVVAGARRRRRGEGRKHDSEQTVLVRCGKSRTTP